MPLVGFVLLVLFVIPGLIGLTIWVQLKAKEKRLERYLAEARDELKAAGAEPLGDGYYRWNERGGKIDASPNPLFRRGFSVRVAAWSDTIHEVELKRGQRVPADFERFKPLLERWDQAGKMITECYAAGVTEDPRLSSTFRALLDLSAVPLSKTWRGGTFTYREGFEDKVPQWHWRHDQRPKLPKELKRYCFSYWQDSPLLNPVLMRVLWELSESSRRYFITPVDDLRFLEYGFGARELARSGALVELKKPDMPVAADLLTDGEFFGGLLAAKELPAGFESEQMPKVQYHDAAIKVLRQVDFYARRLFDDEFAWFSGEVEIVSTLSLDVRGVLAKLATELGGQVMDIDRRFNKRIVVPLNY